MSRMRSLAHSPLLPQNYSAFDLRLILVADSAASDTEAEALRSRKALSGTRCSTSRATSCESQASCGILVLMSITAGALLQFGWSSGSYVSLADSRGF
jgi:hypothetical protein